MTKVFSPVAFILETTCLRVSSSSTNLCPEPFNNTPPTPRMISAQRLCVSGRLIWVG